MHNEIFATKESIRLYSSLIPLEKLQVKQTLLVQVIVEIKKLNYLPINGQTTVKATDSCL